MKNASLIIACCILSVFIIPSMFLMGIEKEKDSEYDEHRVVAVLNHITNEVFYVDFEEYVWRVVAKEMPSSFEMEALKAQAVAARTYAMRKIHGELLKEHNGAQVCTNPAHCSAYMSDSEAKEAWGEKYEEIKAKYCEAGRSTRGETVVYEGELATTVFHAMSSGMTENSKDVWGGSVPYLVSVDSSVDKNAKGYETEVCFSVSELRERLGMTDIKDKENIFGTIERTEGGGVEKIEIFGKEFKGTEIRALMGLRSANFLPRVEGENIIFKVLGYGHGVGMSQVGANEYAKQGYTYKDILIKYYPGTKINGG